MSQNVLHGEPPADAGSSSNNRYILLAVLAFAAVVAIYIVKTNLEPPKPGQIDETQANNSRILTDGEPADADTSATSAMHQAEHIREILAKDSSNFEAWAALGNIYFDAGIAEEAIRHYRRALVIRSDDLNVWTDLATMERAAGRPDTAVAILHSVLAADSMRSQAWFNLGVIQSSDLKDNRAAIAAWKKFLALSPPSEHAQPVRDEIGRLEKELGM